MQKYKKYQSLLLSVAKKMKKAFAGAGEAVGPVRRTSRGRMSEREGGVCGERANGLKLNYRFAPRRAGDITAIWADPTLANTLLGWRAERPLEETLRTAWQWQLHLGQR